MRILLTPTFERALKKMHKPQKLYLDGAVRSVSQDPGIGDSKVGDLAGVRVYKFRMNNQLCLLSYRSMDENTIKLLTFGTHENFYRDLKDIEY